MRARRFAHGGPLPLEWAAVGACCSRRRPAVPCYPWPPLVASEAVSPATHGAGRVRAGGRAGRGCGGWEADLADPRDGQGERGHQERWTIEQLERPGGRAVQQRPGRVAQGGEPLGSGGGPRRSRSGLARRPPRTRTRQCDPPDRRRWSKNRTKTAHGGSTLLLVLQASTPAAEAAMEPLQARARRI
jgi:hypothetical protein